MVVSMGHSVCSFPVTAVFKSKLTSVDREIPNS
jgi:hypothetical protein